MSVPIRLSAIVTPPMTTTFQLLEIVGTSQVSSDDAIRNGIRKVSSPSRQVDWFEVKETRGQVKEGQVTQFQVTLKVGIRLEESLARQDPSPR